MSAFVDTSALFAFIVATDEHHLAAVDALGRALVERRHLETTSYVIIECASLLQRRVGLDAVRDLDRLWVPRLKIEWVNEPLHARAMQRLIRENRRLLSLVDCTSFEFMRSAKIQEAFAFDPHFAEAGFRPLPG